MRRTAKGKRLELTGRDIEIFKALSRYRYLRSTYLHAFAGGASETRFKERLGDLFHEGYLDRPEAQWRFADCRHAPVVHELGRGAARVLQEQGISNDERRVLLGSQAHRQFEHSVMICEVLASIELAAMADPALRFIPASEILEKAPEATRNSHTPLRLPIRPEEDRFVVPDAIFGLGYLSRERPSYRFFAVEADRGTMPVARGDKEQSSYVTKLRAYVAALAEDRPRGLWGVPNLLLLSVTRSTQREENIREAARASGIAHRALLFKAAQISAGPLMSILSTPWARIGVPSISLNTPE